MFETLLAHNRRPKMYSRTTNFWMNLAIFAVFLTLLFMLNP
jgi:hypothetical protein